MLVPLCNSDAKWQTSNRKLNLAHCSRKEGLGKVCMDFFHYISHETKTRVASHHRRYRHWSVQPPNDIPLHGEWGRSRSIHCISYHGWSPSRWRGSIAVYKAITQDECSANILWFSKSIRHLSRLLQCLKDARWPKPPMNTIINGWEHMDDKWQNNNK